MLGGHERMAPSPFMACVLMLRGCVMPTWRSRASGAFTQRRQSTTATCPPSRCGHEARCYHASQHPNGPRSSQPRTKTETARASRAGMTARATHLRKTDDLHLLDRARGETLKLQTARIERAHAPEGGRYAVTPQHRQDGHDARM